MAFVDELRSAPAFIVRQRKELAELFGFESRNKYEILRADGQAVAYAAEQQKGLLGFLLRQLLGHWRRFDVQFFTPDRQPVMVARHPFRIFFQRLEVADVQGRPIGALQQRFGLLHKTFDLEGPNGQVLATVRSPLWKPWTFAFDAGGRTVAVIRKRWSGMLQELVTDADNFFVEVADPSLSGAHRALLLAAAIFVDLQYFENKARRE